MHGNVEGVSNNDKLPSEKNHTSCNTASISYSALSVTIVTRMNTNPRTGPNSARIEYPIFACLSVRKRFKTNCVLCAADWKFHDSCERIRSLDPRSRFSQRADPFPRKCVREIAGYGVSSRASGERARLAAK